MTESGNGRPERCALNLLRTTRGEVPYERLKGLERSIVDTPAVIAAGTIEADIQWLMETYEPRINLNSINLSALIAREGQFGLNNDLVATGGR